MASPGLGTTRRDRRLILASLLSLTLLAWLYLWIDPGPMAPMSAPGDGMEAGAIAADAGTVPWHAGVLLLTFLMWAVMMVGMMLPSATPAILLYARLARNRQTTSPLPSAWVFSAGYLAIWSLFSLGATLLQATFESGRLLSPMLASTSVWFSAALLILAGLYQWLPLKRACLDKCRSPLALFLMHWHPGSLGAFRMGMEHGLYCVGCCWALMLLLFVAGVMNLLWVALIAGFVLVEKLLPPGRLIGHLAGIGLLLTGAGMLVSSF
jgi:predicted metal-binding membrane protein